MNGKGSRHKNKKKVIPYIVPSTVSKKISKTKKMILFEKKSRANSCNIMDSPYLCIVFFIVLDLRLTRLGYSGIPFFLPLLEGNSRISRFSRISRISSSSRNALAFSLECCYLALQFGYAGLQGGYLLLLLGNDLFLCASHV